jgi:RimJ/RimL family protein N-acetyltransferase
VIEIRPFNPAAATDAEWAAIHVFRRIRAEEDIPGEIILDDKEFEREALQVWPLYELRRWFAWEGDTIVGVVGASLRRAGTADYQLHAPYIYGWGGVRMHERRHGVATNLLGSFLGFMRERNKTIATFDTHVPDGHAFLAAIGGGQKLNQIENRARFDTMDWAMLAHWRSVVLKYASLRLDVHGGRVPRDSMERLLPQLSALLADVPLDELDSPPPRYELPAWLSWYEELDRHCGDHMLVMLMEEERIVAVCEASWDGRFPDRVYQMLTAVAPLWRGRGFGKGVKAAMMDLIRERHPDIRFITTSNANLNAPMLAINSRLGFIEHRRTTVYQIGFATIAEYLARHGVDAGETF